ncbi:glycosyltransferase [Sporanaerobium hydrogeniformans]|uniref:glycosyltransferase n=1 Tax=Sporanaerobium hydrogeniformans TaxID=3072179 RepID=UPI0015D4845E|nr:glycosyltransferase [Sporanaerobium hydrogeniformans]
MGNVVIVTHWLDGDVIPFVRIGKVLRDRGHKVTLLTHCHFEKMAKEAGLDFEPWDTPEEYKQLVEEMNGGIVLGINNEDFKKKHESFEVRMKEYDKILKYCKEENTVILCKNRSSIAAHMVAEKYELPLASVMMNPTEVVSMISFDRLYGKKDIPLCNKLREEIGLPPIKSWLQWESSPSMTLAFWPSWYAKPEQNWPRPIETIGFPIEEGKEAIKREIPEDFKIWLKEHEKPLLISGGTTKLIDPLFYPMSIAAAELLNKPTIVLSRYKELLPEELPANVRWYSYLPLDEIMPYLGGLIHHGGMGTLSGALRGGVPQLILPCFVDRPYNAALIKELGVGNYLYRPKWKPETIAKAVKELMVPEIKERCLIYAGKMKQNNGVSIAADKVESLMKEPQYIYRFNHDYNGYDYELGEKEEEERSKKNKIFKDLTKEQKMKLLFHIRNRGGC